MFRIESSPLWPVAGALGAGFVWAIFVAPEMGLPTMNHASVTDDVEAANDNTGETYTTQDCDDLFERLRNLDIKIAGLQDEYNHPDTTPARKEAIANELERIRDTRKEMEQEYAVECR